MKNWSTVKINLIKILTFIQHSKLYLIFRISIVDKGKPCLC